MIITIPTYGRACAQRTYQNLPPAIRQQTYLVVQDREKHLFEGGNILILPDHIRDIASTRDHIVSVWPEHKVVMLDDDLDFAVRRTDDRTKFTAAEPSDIAVLMAWLDDCLTIYAHVSVSGREGANRDTSWRKFNGRAMRILGYNTRCLNSHKLKFAPGTFMCDFYMTLELLTRGYQNIINNNFVHNQPGSNTQGGCSGQRTPELQQAAAEFLAAQFPQFVKVVRKETKTSWNGESRYDVRIQWKQAYAFGTSTQTDLLDDGKGGYPDSKGTGGGETVVG